MMSEQPVPEPADVIIFGASALLGIVVGIGVAYGLWSELHRTAEQAALTAAVTSFGVGMGCIGFAVDRPPMRLFLLALGVTMILAFFLGGHAFASIAG